MNGILVYYPRVYTEGRHKVTSSCTIDRATKENMPAYNPHLAYAGTALLQHQLPASQFREADFYKAYYLMRDVLKDFFCAILLHHSPSLMYLHSIPSAMMVFSTTDILCILKVFSYNELQNHVLQVENRSMKICPMLL